MIAFKIKQPVHQGESTAAVCQLDPIDVKLFNGNLLCFSEEGETIFGGAIMVMMISNLHGGHMTSTFSHQMTEEITKEPSCSTSSPSSSHQNQFSEKEPSCSTSSTGSSQESVFTKFIAEGTDNIGAARLLLLEVARQEIVDGFLQVLFVSGFLQRKICQFIEGVRQADSNIYTTTVAPYPQQTAFHEAPLSIMWVTVKGSNTPNHVVPLQSTGRAKLIQWCTIQEESLMVQCGNCNSWAHPECYGIIGTIFTQDSQVPFYCCKPESGMERIVILEINEHQLTMEDLISLQPKHWFTNWLIDFFIGSTSVNENTWFHCFPSVLWETLRKNNRLQIEKYQRLFKSALEKPVLVFPIVQSQEITIIDSLQAADVEAYDDHCKKINRFIQEDIKNVKIAVVPQQQNGSDCGPFTMHYLNQLFTKVDEAEDIKEFVLMMTNLKPKAGNYIRRKFKEQLLHLQQ
ncbi:SENP2 [Mytilus coruscus]|uniref:SENP2 n=1 Tax=Mytilus coruscus TaxID=42192 RepID=A0A6J8C9X5_MYTCO|nr:SENP2 [Mytilus coruscus]